MLEFLVMFKQASNGSNDQRFNTWVERIVVGAVVVGAIALAISAWY